MTLSTGLSHWISLFYYALSWGGVLFGTPCRLLSAAISGSKGVSWFVCPALANFWVSFCWGVLGCVFVPTVVVAGLNVELWAFYFDYKNNSGPELVGVMILNFLGETVFPRPRGGGVRIEFDFAFCRP